MTAAPAPPPPRRVLIIKPSSLGDVVTALPVLRGLRRSFPAAHLAWLVTPGCAGVLAGEGGSLDEIILFDRPHYAGIGRSRRATRDFLRFCADLRRRRFDWVIDLQGLFRSGFLAAVTGAAVRVGFSSARELAPVFYTRSVRVRARHIIDRNIALARAVGIDARREDLALNATPAGRRSAEATLAAHGLAPRRFLLLAPGTRWPTKLYPARLWARVLRELAGEAPVLLVGAEADRRVCDELAAAGGAAVNAPAGNGRAVNLAGQTSTEQLVALIAAAGAVVSCESAASFIAAAAGTPFVTLMGPTHPRRVGPYGPLGTAVVADAPCQGCRRRRCPHMTCMQLIEPKTVAAAARKALDRTRGKPAAAGPAPPQAASEGRMP